MQNFKTLQGYAEATRIPPGKYDHFVVRSFQDNMPTVVHKMPPFRHAFYAIALKMNGSGQALASHYTDFPEGSVVFFNSPFQILSWDIVPDWEGYYILFTEDYITQSHLFENLLEQFPFLKIDKAIPFQVTDVDTKQLLSLYKQIEQEYHGNNLDSFELINAYVFLLLNYVKRYFNQQVDFQQGEQMIRTADLRILNRYQELIATNLKPDTEWDYAKNLHSPTFYADLLNIHPNHLNSVVKTNLGITALQYIHKHLVHQAKSYLTQTDLSVKEIAYQLQFDSPNNFNNFFKKHVHLTPGKYRKSSRL